MFALSHSLFAPSFGYVACRPILFASWWWRIIPGGITKPQETSSKSAVEAPTQDEMRVCRESVCVCQTPRLKNEGEKESHRCLGPLPNPPGFLPPTKPPAPSPCVLWARKRRRDASSQGTRRDRRRHTRTHTPKPESYLRLLTDPRHRKKDPQGLQHLWRSQQVTGFSRHRALHEATKHLR